jgi:hypothetical protein
MQSATIYDVEAYADFYRSPTGMLIKILQPFIGAEVSEVDLLDRSRLISRRT